MGFYNLKNWIDDHQILLFLAIEEAAQGWQVATRPESEGQFCYY